jgi:hypothetical protein
MKSFTVSFTMELDDVLPHTGEKVEYTTEQLHYFIMSAFKGSLADHESIQDMIILEA